MNKTSEKIEDICEGEVEEFFQEFMKIFVEKVKIIKKKIIENEIKTFSGNVTR